MKHSLVKKAAIDPKVWMTRHSRSTHPKIALVPVSAPVLAVGREAIDIHDGNVISAMSHTPDLRAEIALAYLLADVCIGPEARTAIMSLAEAMGTI